MTTCSKNPLTPSGLLAAALALVLVAPETRSDDIEPQLPGAQPIIRAIEYPTLQAAIDEAPPEGGVVELPAGTFEIEEPLRIRQENIVVRGQGPATHIRNTNADGEPTLVIEPRQEGDESGDPQWRVELREFRLTGNEASGHGILAVRVNELFIQGVTVTRHGEDGIRLDHCYENPRIADSQITYNQQAGLNLLGCHDIVVSANQFEENQDAVRCIDGFNLCMTGNNLDDHLRHGVVIENTYGSVVAGNMIEECQGTAILLDRDCYGNTLSANVIAHNGSGIDLRDAHGCAVSANTFTIMTKDALRIGPDSGRITVSANNFSDSYIGDGEVKRQEGDRAAGGLTLDGAAHLTIAGNLFSGLKPKAIRMENDPSRGILFSNNLIFGPTGDPSRLEDSRVHEILHFEGSAENEDR